MVNDKQAAAPDRVRAALGILDRSGYGAGSTLAMVGADGGAVKIEGTPDLRNLSDAQLAQLRELLRAATKPVTIIDNPSTPTKQVVNEPTDGPVN
jgi:hypothetical protein